MITLIVNIVFVALAALLYWQSPEGYTPAFCQTILGLYLLQNTAWLFLGGQQRKLRFELLFMISFLFVNFIYPVFYADSYPHWFLFNYPFNRHIINQATALAYLGYTCYLLGTTELPWLKREEPTHPKWEVSPIHLRCLAVIAIGSFALFVALGGYAMLSNVYGGGGNLKDVGVFSYFYNIFCIATLIMSALVFRLEKKRRWIYLGVLALFVLILLSTGSRSFSLSVILILLVSFSLYVYRLRVWQVVSVLLIGAGMLYAIMQWRSTVSSASMDGISGMLFLDMFADLTINNIGLYILTDWGNTHDPSWLHGMLIDLLSPIPTAGSVLLKSTNEASYQITGGDLPTYILLGPNAGWGVGTNMVGEAYIAFGLVGMCVAMFLTGLCIREAYYRSNGSIYWYVVIMLFVGQAVMWPRAPFLFNPRNLVWSLLLLWLVHHVVTRYQVLHPTTSPSQEASKPTRIVYCIPGLFNSAGMERVLTQKVNWLAEHTDWEITIITTELVPEGKSRNHFPLDERVKVVEWNIDFNADYHRSLPCKLWRHIHKQHIYRRQLTNWLNQHKVDVCISLCGKEIEWLGCAQVSCKKIAEMHFAHNYKEYWIQQNHPGLLWRWIGKYLTYRLSQNLKQMDHLVVLTQADQTSWRKKGVSRVETIINPCSLLPSQMGKHDKKQLLAVGRLHPQKGFDLLLEAWHQLASKYPDWILRIAGEGDSRKALEQQILDLGLSESVSMEGVSQDICADYQSSRLFVLPSRWEGLPLALIEAMSQGTCCVAFDCPQGPSELLQDGVTGRLVSNGDIPALIQALSEQMDDAEGSAQMGEAAYQYAQEHFALEPIMTKWKELLLLPH